MNVSALPQSMPQPVRDSRKLWGLVLVIAALITVLLLFLAASVALAVTGHEGALDWTPCRDVLAFITGSGLGQQLSQGASDVSKWRSQNQPPNIP